MCGPWSLVSRSTVANHTGTQMPPFPAGRWGTLKASANRPNEASTSVSTDGSLVTFHPPSHHLADGDPGEARLRCKHTGRPGECQSGQVLREAQFLRQVQEGQGEVLHVSFVARLTHAG